MNKWEDAVGQLFLLSFDGTQPSTEILDAVARRPLAGVVLFRHRNMGTLSEIRQLSDDLQRAAAAARQPRLLIAADQEGGQLMAVGDATPFPGNMALGAARSTDLARRTGLAIGREMRALGITVNFAPVCDVNSNPVNPVVGTRSFGEDPSLVARLSAAMIGGLQDAGVAAVAKHFPGHGDTSSDSHHGLAVVAHSRERLETVELSPFRSAIAAGVSMIMTAHVAVPALEEDRVLPATLSRSVLRGLLRDRLGFDGVIVSDAMDMKAIRQDRGALVDTLTALAAGVDLLLFNLAPADQQSAYESVLHAADRGLLAAEELRASARRIHALKQRIDGGERPGLEVIRCREHLALAQEVAEHSMTLVQDIPQRLPLHLSPQARIVAIVPQPKDLTPADTSSHVAPSLAAALGAHHSSVTEVPVSLDLTDSDVAAVLERARDADLVVAGTINATEFRGQAALVKALCDRQLDVVAVALRMPYDLAAYPCAPTYVCTYGVLPTSMDALARALWGRIPFAGRLPVSIPGLYERDPD